MSISSIGLRGEFLKRDHILPVIIVERDAFAVLVVGYAVNVVCAVPLVDAAGLTRTRRAVDILYFYRPVLFGVFLGKKRLPQRINVIHPECQPGVLADDLRGRLTGCNAFEQGGHFRGFFDLRFRHMTVFFKAARYRSFCLISDKGMDATSV